MAWLDKSAKQHAAIVTFVWPAPRQDDFGDLILAADVNTLRYTNWTTDLIVDGDTYTSCPQMGITIGEETGRLEANEHVIEMPLDLPPADTLCTIPLHADVEVSIEEVDPEDDSTRRWLGYGWVESARKGIHGRKGKATLKVDPLKGLLADVSLGIVVAQRGEVAERTILLTPTGQ